MTGGRVAPETWAALIGPVADRLLRDRPCRKTGGEWRFGAKGSLAVRVAAGKWYDHEAGKGGGVLDLIEREIGCDRPGALRWLEGERLIPTDRAGFRESDARGSPVSNLSAAGGVSTTPRKSPSKTAPLAAAIIDASVNADDTPARVYLARRWTWPPFGVGPNLPGSVKWCAAASMPAAAHMPPGAAGAVVFVLRRPDTLEDPQPAVSLEAVTADGARIAERWRRTFGAKANRAFGVPVAAGGNVVLVEGECDALAAALCIRAGVTRAVGGTGFTRAAAADLAARPVVLMPDADGAGARAALPLVRDLPDRTVTLARLSRLAGDGDPAGWVRDSVTERAGLRIERGDRPDDAERGAWRDLLADVAAGADILGLMEPPAIEVGAEAATPAPTPRTADRP